MSDLVDFLRARLDEDEEDVEIAHTSGCPSYLLHLTDEQLYEPADPSRCSCDARRDLLEIAAKRSIVALHRPDGPLENWHWSDRRCADCGHPWHRVIPYRQPTEIGPEIGCPTVCALASIWRDHPDYRDEWRSPGRLTLDLQGRYART